MTHNLEQAARASDYVAFMYLGRVIEFCPTTTVFDTLRDERTANYLAGRYVV